MNDFGNELDAYIASGDLGRIRSAIISIVGRDANESIFRFKGAAEYAHRKLEATGSSLFETDDGVWRMPVDEESWDKQLWFRMKVAMRDNFSREKMDAMERIMVHLREQGDPSFQIYPEKNKNFRGNRHHQIIGIGAAGGAVLGFGLGLVAGQKIWGAVAGALVGGGLALYLSRKEI
jgi:hypothetical protein